MDAKVLAEIMQSGCTVREAEIRVASKGHIGHLRPRADGKGHEVVCKECAKGQGTPIYHANIHPYKQSCAECGKTIAEGSTPAWPELFPKSGS